MSDAEPPGAGDRPLRDGTISSIEFQKRDATRVSIFIDGEFAFGLTADTATALGLKKGQTLSVAEQSEILDKDQFAAARRVALTYLARRARTVAEVRKKLLESGFSEPATTSALHRIQELGYLDDEDYARRYAAARLGRRYGPHRVLQELRRRGVPPEVAQEAVAGASRDEDVFDQVRSLAESRYQRLAGENDVRKRKKKVFDFLLRRGYGSEIAWRVIDELGAD